MLLFNQLLILLWKCWIMRLRHWMSTIFELLTPLLLTILIVYVHSKAQVLDQTSNTTLPEEYNKTPKPETTDNYNGPIIYNNPRMEIDGSIFDLHFYPVNEFTNDITKRIKEKNYRTKIVLYQTIDELNGYIASVVSNISLLSYNTIAVIFDSSHNRNLTYTIRMTNGIMTNAVKRLYPNKYNAGPFLGSLYSDSFSILQTLINEAFLDRITNNRRTLNPSSIKAYQMPYPKYLAQSNENNSFTVQEMISFAIILGYVIMCPLIVKRICDEKVAKAKEMLRMMGMSDWVFWGSHFINYFTVMFIQNIFFTLSYCYGYGGNPLIKQSSSSLFFIIVQLYMTQSVLFCMTLTTVFNRPVIGVIFTVIIWIMSYSVPMGMLNPGFHSNMDVTATNKWRILSVFLPNMGLSWSISLIGQYEIFGSGALWTNLWSSTTLYGDFSIGLVMLIMLISCFKYCVLIWYIDSVWPWQFGIPKPLYFPFQPSYWFPSNGTVDDDKHELIKNKDNYNERNFEPEPKLTVGIVARNLRKEFGGFGSDRKTAVQDVSMNIYRGQIMILLGHNGAGKTTTMNMLTGIYPPTKGTAHIDGFNVAVQTLEARRSIALCPQENIIYNELTVYQHLKLYAVLKGFVWEKIDEEIGKTLESLRLTDKRNAMAESLSGGMKRKLSLGIAMIGGSKILILDEPTSGMDPEARRAVWDVLQEIRSDKTILLTTHFMEEADVLGDRIAIMVEGRVTCCGSPMFLKNRFGTGYHLRLAKGQNYNTQLVDATIRKHLADASIKSDIHTEVIYSLENENANDNTKRINSKFPALFNDLENGRNILGVDSFGMTITTMEDVFLRVGHEFERTDDGPIRNDQIINGKSSESLIKEDKVKGFELTAQRYKGLLLKRFHFSRRYWPMIIFQLVLPAILFMAVLFADYGIRNSTGDNVNLALNLKDLYGETEGFILSVRPDFISSYETIAGKYGMKSHTLNITDNPNIWALKYAENLDIYIKKYLIGAVIKQSESPDRIELNPWFNNEALHSLPLSINLLYEALAKYETKEDVTINVNNYPASEGSSVIESITIIIGWIVSCLLLTPITVPFIGASYVLFPINERISKSKLLQLMTGLSPSTFWCANFLFDLINHFIAMIGIFLVFLMFDFNRTYFGRFDTAFALLLMLFLFGFASIPLAYCFSYWFKRPATGFTVLVIIYLFCGLIINAVMSFFDLTLNVFYSDTVIQRSTFNSLLFLFRFIPVFSMNFGIQKLYRTGSLASVCTTMDEKYPVMLQSLCRVNDPKNLFYGCCREFCAPKGDCYTDRSPFTFKDHGISMEFIFMVISGIIFFMVLWLFEGNLQKYWYRLTSRTNCFKPKMNAAVEMTDKRLGPVEDSDVTTERDRIMDSYERKLLNQESMAVIDLTKHFNGYTAVNHLTFGVHKRECFGFLGVNGAGKTTTFEMLTGNIFLSNGNAYIGDDSLVNDLQKFQKQIGYCPQFDGLLDRMTGREMLYLFGRLRGIPNVNLDMRVQHLIEMVDLQNHADRCTELYSGGNRRKLSLALAIIGTPPVIFLDEPTSGVDPAARRKIWTTLVHIQEKYKCSIVLTSHSMDECEALCSRIAIMVNGKFKCLGPTQHLRSKYGEGFTVVIKLKRELNDDDNYVSRVKDYINKVFPSAELKDFHQLLMHYHITDTSVQWSHMFRLMEEAKEILKFEDYFISDTTLEQIFLTFARSQRPVL